VLFTRQYSDERYLIEVNTDFTGRLVIFNDELFVIELPKNCEIVE